MIKDLLSAIEYAKANAFLNDRPIETNDIIFKFCSLKGVAFDADCFDAYGKHHNVSSLDIKNGKFSSKTLKCFNDVIIG